MVEVATISRKAINEKTEILISGIRPIRVKFYWDSHGKLISWKQNGVSELPRKTVKIELICKSGEWVYEDGDKDSFSHTELYLDGKKISGELYSLTPAGLAKVVVGWG